MADISSKYPTLKELQKCSDNTYDLNGYTIIRCNSNEISSYFNNHHPRYLIHALTKLINHQQESLPKIYKKYESDGIHYFITEQIAEKKYVSNDRIDKKKIIMKLVNLFHFLHSKNIGFVQFGMDNIRVTKDGNIKLINIENLKMFVNKKGEKLLSYESVADTQLLPPEQIDGVYGVHNNGANYYYLDKANVWQVGLVIYQILYDRSAIEHESYVKPVETNIKKFKLLRFHGIWKKMVKRYEKNDAILNKNLKAISDSKISFAENDIFDKETDTLFEKMLCTDQNNRITFSQIHTELF